MPPRVSILIPTLDGGALFERVLERLAGQSTNFAWDVLVIDSGSSDGTEALLARRAANFPVPFAWRAIHPSEFDHGDTRNELAASSTGELCVFLTQDALPADEGWLERLAANFADPKVGAAYCRNVARPDADLLTRVFSAGDPGYAAERREAQLPEASVYAALDPHARRLLYNFNDVASAVRRELWERHPFPRTPFGEDVLLARALLEDGWTVVYDERACVEHSHDYTPSQMRARAVIDGRFNAEWLDRICVASRSDADALVARQLERDRDALVASGLAGAALARELGRARALREALFHGLYEGGRTARRRASSRVRATKTLDVLYVVHGFPPDTWAGTEVHTLELARAVQERGHKASVLARAPAALAESEGGPAEWSVREDVFQGVRVRRVFHRYERQTLGESYRRPEAEALFRELLERERPDVVHFQHLLHLSAGLVGVARELGVPTVLTLNDYWPLCARVQLIRPDGVRCDGNQGMGCLACVKDKDPKSIAGARRWLPWLAPFVHATHAVVGPLPKQVFLPKSMPLRIVAKRKVKLARLADSFLDMERRNDFVLGNCAAADLVIAPSRFLRQKYLDTGRFDPERVVYSDYGMRTADLAVLEKLREPQGRVRFGFVGSLVWYKGGEVLIEALNRLAGRPCVLNVFGDFRPESDAHHARLKELAKHDNVSFRGPFDNARLAEVYREIDVLVVPSLWFENSPLTIHEAFLQRTPVVTSGIGGMAELVRDGVDGLHFEAGDAEDLARTLARFVDEPKLVAQLSRSWMRVKSVEENAREMEYRYRALVCRSASGNSATVANQAK